MNKINFLTGFFWSLARTPQKRLVLFLAILPILVLIAFFSLLETSSSNTFFMIIFLLSHYIGVFAVVMVFRAAPERRLARSPFYFIKALYSEKTLPWTYFEIPKDQTRRHLIGAEIGVDQGINAKTIMDFLNIEQLVLVDPWVGLVDGSTGILAEETIEYNEAKYKNVKESFSNNPKVRIIRDFSVNAAKMFDDEYFDFIYIDADHSYESVSTDLEAWYPKLKKFGVLCGDDFGHPTAVGVIEAVTQFAFNHKLIARFGEEDQYWFVKV